MEHLWCAAEPPNGRLINSEHDYVPLESGETAHVSPRRSSEMWVNSEQYLPLSGFVCNCTPEFHEILITFSFGMVYEHLFLFQIIKFR